MKNKCKCGNYEKCVREVGATDSGKLYIIGGFKNHFKCGIVKNQIEKLNDIMKNKLYILAVIGLMAIGCSRKSAPTIIYQDKIVNSVDTVTIQSRVTDTIPCDDFEIYIENEVHDTVYLKVVDRQVSIKYIKVRDTVFRETIIVQPTPRKSVIKTDNSVKIKLKDGSVIGDGNKIDNSTINNFWKGFFCAFALLYGIGIISKILNLYVPPSVFITTIIKKILPGGI